VPKKITNAQTVCNEKNEKGKLCNGHLKQVHTGGEEAEQHLRGDDVLFKCQFCGTLYMGPPLGHVRDPYKQQRFVERELTAILQAAGGTLPAIVKNEKGAFVLAEAQTGHAHAPAKPAATQTPAAAATNDAAQAADTAARQAGPSAAPKTAGQSATSAAPTPAAAKPAAEAKTIAGYVPPPAPGPVPGETPEQKLERLRAIVAEAKRRKTAAEAAAGDQPESATEPQPAPAVQTQPAAADTSGTDSSAQADAHRPAAEAQAATGQASAVPLNPSAANASPAAAEQRADSHGTPGRAAFDTGPVAGETYEQKIARLKLVVNAARELAGKPPKY
jgi:chemotaxis protein histidine kinase CheA